MTNRQTRVDSRRSDGQNMSITQHETDSPLIPVAQIERLHAILPERVDWVFNQTEIEAEHRRHIQGRRDTMVFAERICGQLLAVVTCSAALYCAYLLGMANHDIAAAAIGTTAVVGLATAFLRIKR